VTDFPAVAFELTYGVSRRRDNLGGIMGSDDWLGLENLKAVFRHTLHGTAAILSFMWIKWLVGIGLRDG
jgi:hypothetical protein